MKESPIVFYHDTADNKNVYGIRINITPLGLTVLVVMFGIYALI